MPLPKLHIFEDPVSIAQLAEATKIETLDLIDFATQFYGVKSMKLGDHIGRMIGTRMDLGEYRPYSQDIRDTARILDNVLGVRTLQHSVSIGCSTHVRDLVFQNDLGVKPSPTIMGTIDWQQVGENLSPVVSMAVLKNPIQPAAPILSANIGPAAFGLMMMNGQVAVKLNRAPMPNVKHQGIDLSSLNEDEYADIKKANNLPYMLKTVADSVFRGRPPSAYLLRHAVNMNMDFDETVDYIASTKTSDFSIMTVVGEFPGQAVTIEKHRDESSIYNGYEASTNHWSKSGDFSDRPSLPRTLNSEFRACAMEDETRKKLFKGEHFSFANDGVVDDTTRVLLEANPATGRMSLVTSFGSTLTSQAVTACFDGTKLQDVEHFSLEPA